MRTAPYPVAHLVGFRPGFLSALLALLATAFPVAAGDAVFSHDASRVYLNDASPGTLAVIGLPEGRRSRLPHPPPLAESGELDAIDRSRTGSLLLLAQNTLWEFEPETAHLEKRYAVAAPVQLTAFAHDPVTGGILLMEAGSEESGLELRWLPSGSAPPQRVFNRRCPFLRDPTFTPDGRLLFSHEGDLWMGSLAQDTDSEPPRQILNAYRHAPLALRETALGTPSQIGVRGMAVAGDWLYVQLCRMGGSGWGETLRIKAPAPGAVDDPPKDTAESRTRMLQIFGSLEPLGDNGGQPALCASRDGRLVFFLGEGRNAFLIEDGKPPASLGGAR